MKPGAMELLTTPSTPSLTAQQKRFTFCRLRKPAPQLKLSNYYFETYSNITDYIRAKSLPEMLKLPHNGGCNVAAYSRFVITSLPPLSIKRMVLPNVLKRLLKPPSEEKPLKVGTGLMFYRMWKLQRTAHLFLHHIYLRST